LSRDYVPALGHRALTSLYDPVNALTMRESAWRGPVTERIADLVGDAGTIVDIGAGTGSFAVEIARRIPGAEVIAVDGDPEVIEIGRRKTGDLGVVWKQGLADALPVDDGSVDLCLISLVLHHLDRDDKQSAIVEAERVLRPGGSLIVADWGRPSAISRPGFLALRLLDGFGNTAEHFRGEIPSMIEAGGFGQVERFGRVDTIWGTVELLRAGQAS
jgi:ubiquinone/menaquinone biosynthesis C-methylase UbiE